MNEVSTSLEMIKNGAAAFNGEGNTKKEYQQEGGEHVEGKNKQEKRKESSNATTRIRDEDPYDEMITFLTGREKSERSSKERAIIFPVKVSNIRMNNIPSGFHQPEG